MEYGSLEITPPTLVLIDDNQDALGVAGELFEVCLPGWRVLATNHLTQGIPYQAKEIVNQLTGPVIFLVDYHMPGKNGLQLIEDIRPYLLVQAKFMLVTAETDHNVYIQAHERGVDVFCKAPPEGGAAYNFGDLFVAKIKLLASDLFSIVEKSVDEITGAYTMRGFGDHWVQMTNVMRRDHSWAALIFFDVNDFKVVNDLYQDHEPGNKLLRAIYTAAREHVRVVDPIGRKGDEFFVALRIAGDTKTEVEQRAKEIGQRIQQSVSELSVEVRKGEFRATSISFGVTVINPYELRENPENSREVAIEEMKKYLKLADQASYADKFANYERLKEAGDKAAEKKYLYYKNLREQQPIDSSL